ATQATSEWKRTTTRNLDVDPREVGAVFAVTLALGSVDWNAVKSVQCVVAYDDRPNGIHAERTVQLTQDAPTAVVPIRPRDPKRQQFTVRATFFYGNVQELVEVLGAGESLVPVNPPATRAIPVQVRAV